MPALQVRDFPDDLYERLKACAALEHRSVAQQAIIAVERMLEGSDPFPRARKNPCFIDFGSEAERASRKKKREALFEGSTIAAQARSLGCLATGSSNDCP